MIDAKALDDMHPSELEYARDFAGERVGEGAPPPQSGAPPRAGVPQKRARATRALGLGRRAFLAGLVASLGLLAAGRVWARARPGVGAGAHPLAGLLRHRSSAAAIGERYLRDHPAERAAALRLSGPPAAGASDRSDWRRSLQHEVRRDFAEGRVVRVDGWILSRTEARLCAAVRLGAGR